MLRCAQHDKGAQHDRAVLTVMLRSGSLAMDSEMLRCAQHDKVAVPSCHGLAKRRSLAMGIEMLRCAQHDKRGAA